MNDYSLAPTMTWIFIGLIALFLCIYAWNEMTAQTDARPPAPERVPQGGQPATSPWEECSHCRVRVLTENTIRGWCQDCRENHPACWLDFLHDVGHRMVLDEIFGGTLPMSGAGLLAVNPVTGEVFVVPDPDGPTPEDIEALHSAIADEALDEEDHR